MSSGLELQNVTMRFGGLTAVGDLRATIEAHDLIGLIGPNGAEGVGLQPAQPRRMEKTAWLKKMTYLY